MSNYSWLDQKVLKSINQINLWPENPRLNPEENHLSISDFAEDLIVENADKEAFIELVKSIATKGFIPFDPVVVWTENKKTYVAEGNRRILAIKLLLNPNEAPLSIRSTIKKHSGKADITSLEKVMVNLAPNFDDAEWYINERNAGSSLHRSWSRVQQHRWVLELYTKYSGNMEIISSKTTMTSSELQSFIRFVKIRDYVNDSEMSKHMSKEDIVLAASIKFPISILERWFSSPAAREHFTLVFDTDNVSFTGDKTRFFIAFSNLIERIIHRQTKYKDSDLRIDNRRITSHFQEILDSLPRVKPDEREDEDEEREEETDTNDNTNTGSEGSGTDGSSDSNDEDSKDKSKGRKKWMPGDPNRPYLVLPRYDIDTDQVRIGGLFGEFKKISLAYGNTVGVAIRVFLDLSVLYAIESNGYENEIKLWAAKTELRDIPLKKRLQFLEYKKMYGTDSNKILKQLVDPKAVFSLDILNGFAHGKKSVFLEKTYLNSFWDYLFPLFQEIHVINEKK